MEELGRLRALYESIGYPTFAISAKYGSIEDLKNEFIGKTTLLSGNSGVGKSTLLNAIFGETVTRTADISQAHDKGMHTTTFSEMYFLDERQKTKDKSCGAIIDTPGVKGFGTIDMQKEADQEINEITVEFNKRQDTFNSLSALKGKSRECRYSNCLHCGEPGCAVLPEVGESIAETRFESYLSILSDAGEGKYR